MEENLRVVSTAYPNGDLVKYNGHGMPRPQVIYGLDRNDVQKAMDERMKKSKKK